MKGVLALFLAILLLAIPAQSLAQNVTITLYGDGSAQVAQTFTLQRNETSITIPLISSQIQNVFATDENQDRHSYQISGSNITVFTLGATQINLVYEAPTLAQQTGQAWIASFALQSQATLILPTNATELFSSQAPISINVAGSRTTMTLGRGSWEVYYGLPVEVLKISSTSTTGSVSTTTGAPPNVAIYAVGAGLAVVLVALVAYVLRKRT